MTGHDEEFDEFLSRKRPVFRRPTDHEIEPPIDVDRLVLRQARDAIKPPQPERMYRGPGWGVPLAVAATLLVCLSMVLHVVTQKKAAPGETTRQIAQQVDAAAAASAPAAAESMTDAVAPTTVAPTTAAPAAPADASARIAGTSNTPWRGDARSWLAEIERLRAAGKGAEADAELALYKRQHRAYASSPDR